MIFGIDTVKNETSLKRGLWAILSNKKEIKIMYTHKREVYYNEIKRKTKE